MVYVKKKNYIQDTKGVGEITWDGEFSNNKPFLWSWVGMNNITFSSSFTKYMA